MDDLLFSLLAPGAARSFVCPCALLGNFAQWQNRLVAPSTVEKAGTACTDEALFKR
jgi:hypothetical protein